MPELIKNLNNFDIQIQDDSATIKKHTRNENFSVNTGFQLIRSNYKTIYFYYEILKLIEKSDLQDQKAYTLLLYHYYNYYLNWIILDKSLFSNGWNYFILQMPQKLNIKPFIIHNNWIRGLSSKIHRFKEEHLWFLPPPDYFSSKSIFFFFLLFIYLILFYLFYFNVFIFIIFNLFYFILFYLIYFYFILFNFLLIFCN